MGWFRDIARLLLPLVWGAAVGLASPSARAESPRLGFTVGGNWSLLTQPHDAPGQPTLMAGTAFDGFGAVLGPSLDAPLGHLDATRLGLDIDLLYSRHRATGYERRSSPSRSRRATLSTHVLQIPLTFTLEPGVTDGWLQLALGPTLWWGLAGEALGSATGAATPPSIESASVFHGGLLGQIAFRIPVGEQFHLPLEFRALWDPFVGETTPARFRDFKSARNPGRLEVAYDWQLSLATGVSWSWTR